MARKEVQISFYSVQTLKILLPFGPKPSNGEQWRGPDAIPGVTSKAESARELTQEKSKPNRQTSLSRKIRLNLPGKQENVKSCKVSAAVSLVKSVLLGFKLI